jgi:hypothetical protein
VRGDQNLGDYQKDDDQLVTIDSLAVERRKSTSIPLFRGQVGVQVMKAAWIAFTPALF